MAGPLTLAQAWGIRDAVGAIAAADRQPLPEGHQRSVLAIAARRASNESAVRHLAAMHAAATRPPSLPRV